MSTYLFRPRFWLRVLLWFIVLALLWGAFRLVPPARVWTVLTGIRTDVLFMLVVLNTLILWGFGARGWLLLRALGHPIGYHRQVGYRIAAFGVNYFTPGPQFGGEPLHVFLLKRAGVPVDVAVTAVGVDRLLEFVVNGAFLLVGVGLLSRTGLLPLRVGSSLVAGTVVLLVLPAGYLSLLALGWSPMHRVATWLEGRERLAGLKRAVDGVARSEQYAYQLGQTHPGTLVLALAISLATWVLLIGEYALMMAALDVHPTFVQLIIVMTAARLAFLFPSPGGLGALEGGQVMVMQALGWEPALGLSLSLLIRARDVLVGAVGLLLARYLLEKPAWSPAPDAPSASYGPTRPDVHIM